MRTASARRVSAGGTVASSFIGGVSRGRRTGGRGAPGRGGRRRAARRRDGTTPDRQRHGSGLVPPRSARSRVPNGSSAANSRRCARGRCTETRHAPGRPNEVVSRQATEASASAASTASPPTPGGGPHEAEVADARFDPEPEGGEPRVLTALPRGEPNPAVGDPGLRFREGPDLEQRDRGGAERPRRAGRLERRRPHRARRRDRVGGTQAGQPERLVRRVQPEDAVRRARGPAVAAVEPKRRAGPVQHAQRPRRIGQRARRRRRLPAWAAGVGEPGERRLVQVVHGRAPERARGARVVAEPVARHAHGVRARRSRCSGR